MLNIPPTLLHVKRCLIEDSERLWQDDAMTSLLKKVLAEFKKKKILNRNNLTEKKTIFVKQIEQVSGKLLDYKFKIIPTLFLY